MFLKKMETLKSLFSRHFGIAPTECRRLTPAGSNREYWRLTSDSSDSIGHISAIGVIGTSSDENRAFFTICRQLRSKGLPVPELYLTADDGSRYLQQDLGDTALFNLLEPCRSSGIYDGSSVSLLEKVMTVLPDIQFLGADGLDFSVCYPVESFDRRSILWDLNYFKYYFLKTSGLEFHEALLEDDFDRLTAILLKDAPYDTFMYRDFQSRNVMVRDGAPWFIDFQGGRRGPVEYDLASFLWQARAAYPKQLREHLINTYIGSLQRYRRTDTAQFRAGLNHIVLFRTLQVLGAYGFRGTIERKPHFLASIPAAIANLRELLDEGTGRNEYPYLYGLLLQLTNQDYAGQPSATAIAQNADGPQPLTVRITSFSYRKGIPEDNSGNGGGFVFDCRSMHNPGLYDRYKPLDGRDREVIDFLDEQGEIQKFLNGVYSLTDPAVEKYLSRGFTSLAVSFGCTGGHHRSVRSAECLAAHLHGKYGSKLRIVLAHRELKTTTIL